MTWEEKLNKVASQYDWLQEYPNLEAFIEQTIESTKNELRAELVEKEQKDG